MTSSPRPGTGKAPSTKTAKPRFSNDLGEIIAKLLKDNPGDTDAEMFDAFKELIGFNTAVVRRAALLEPMIERDFLVQLHKVRPVAKALSGLNKPEPRAKPEPKAKPEPGQTPEQRAAARKAYQDRVADAISGLIRDASQRLLELMTPMGKTLGATTFGECAQLGGWYADLAKKGPADQPIGDALTEAQVRAFFDTYTRK